MKRKKLLYTPCLWMVFILVVVVITGCGKSITRYDNNADPRMLLDGYVVRESNPYTGIGKTYRKLKRTSVNNISQIVYSSDYLYVTSISAQISDKNALVKNTFSVKKSESVTNEQNLEEEYGVIDQIKNFFITTYNSLFADWRKTPEVPNPLPKTSLRSGDVVRSVYIYPLIYEGVLYDGSKIFVVVENSDWNF